MKHIRILMLFGACLFALTAFTQQNPPAKEGGDHAHGQHAGHMQLPSADDMLKEFTSKLDLTADQQPKVKAILEEHLQQAQGVMKDACKDESSKDCLSKEDMHAKMQSIHNSLHAKVREVLTDDQKKKFDVMVKEHEHEHQGKGHEAPGHEHK
jgi:hypothetical protein